MYLYNVHNIKIKNQIIQKWLQLFSETSSDVDDAGHSSGFYVISFSWISVSFRQDTESLHLSNAVFDANAETAEFTIMFPFFSGQFSVFGLFVRNVGSGVFLLQSLIPTVSVDMCLFW